VLVQGSSCEGCSKQTVWCLLGWEGHRKGLCRLVVSPKQARVERLGWMHEG
jgi:hypothetical protein